MNTYNMMPNLEETFEYRHKKFDQSKRLRSDSLSSSSGDYECIRVEIDRIDKGFQPQIPRDNFSSLNWCKAENTLKRTSSPTVKSEDSFNLPEAKRPRLGSFSDSSSNVSSFSPLTPLRHTSTPFNASTTATGVPPATAILPKISNETLHSICKYHGNMVRKFPKKERTPKDQERRNKNTIACRMSRRVKKLEHIAIEEQYKEFSQQTFAIIEKSMRITAYLHELMKLSSSSQGGEIKTESPKMLNEMPLSSGQTKKPFTVAFLTGKE